MTPLLFAALVVTQAVVVVTWHRCLGLPGAVGGALVAGGAAMAADVLAVDSAVDSAGNRPLSDVPGVLALAVLAALVHQLARRNGRDRLTASLTATVTLVALAALGSAYVAAWHLEDGPGLVAVTATAAVLVVAGVAVRHRLGGSHRHDIGGVAAATGAAALVVVVPGALDVLPALVVGGGSALLAWVATALVARAPVTEPVQAPESWQRPALGAALPVLVAGPVAYVLGRLVLG